MGVVVAVFSLVGFECASAFGEEARNPLRTIPRAIIASLMVTGAFFVFITYVETHALANNNPTLDKLDAPLSTLSANLGVPWLGVLISIGAMISFFALAMSCLNAGGRVMFTMGRYGVFPISVSSSPRATSLHTWLFRCLPPYNSSSPPCSFFCLTPPWAAGKWRPSFLSTTRACFGAMGFAGRMCSFSFGHATFI